MIVFQNPGLIPLEAVTTMGVSVKAEGAIGFFGTGVKFAIATVLRLGGSVTIYRGYEAHRFTTREMVVQGAQGQAETFQQVCMNGQPLGFTTQLGRNWEAWMAWREFATNAKDEGGRNWFSKGGEIAGGENMTTILVENCPAFEEAHKDRHQILLETEPLFANDYVEIHPGRGSEYVFYRGVRVHTSARRTALVYNVKRKLELTEDRTNRWDFQVHDAIVSGLTDCKDAELLRAALDCGESFLEHHLSFQSFAQPSEEFVTVSGQLALGKAAAPRANPSVVANVRRAQLAKMEPSENMALNEVQVAMLNRAKTMLRDGGYDVDQFPVVIAETLGAEIHGMARDGKIFVSALAFNKGTRELAATLFEEFAHLKSGQADCTRGFQNWLFDQLLCRIEAEQGEPF